MTIRVAESARIFLQEAVERCAKFKVVQIYGKGTRLIIVIDLPMIEHRMGECLDRRRWYCSCVAVAFQLGNIRYATIVDKYLYDRVVDLDRIEIPASLQNRNHTDTRLSMSHLEHRRIRIRVCAIHRKAVEIYAQAR